MHPIGYAVSVNGRLYGHFITPRRAEFFAGDCLIRAASAGVLADVQVVELHLPRLTLVEADLHQEAVA